MVGQVSTTTEDELAAVMAARKAERKSSGDSRLSKALGFLSSRSAQSSFDATATTATSCSDPDARDLADDAGSSGRRSSVAGSRARMSQRLVTSEDVPKEHPEHAQQQQQQQVSSWCKLMASQLVIKTNFINNKVE
jgi:hypothetical protein